MILDIFFHLGWVSSSIWIRLGCDKFKYFLQAFRMGDCAQYTACVSSLYGHEDTLSEKECWFPLLQWFWWVWDLQGPRIHKFQFQLVQNNSHLLVPGTFLFFEKDFKRPEMELSAFTMKEKTRSKAKRNTLELFAVNSKQYKLILAQTAWTAQTARMPQTALMAQIAQTTHTARTLP